MSTSPLRRRSPPRGIRSLGCVFRPRSGCQLARTRNLLELFGDMVLLRRFETAAQVACRKGETPGFLHLYIGEEATAVGVCAHLRRTDWITSTHRGHGHALAKGMEPAPCSWPSSSASRRLLRRPRRHHASLRPRDRPVRHQRHRRRRHWPSRSALRIGARRARHATTSRSPSSATAPPTMAASTRRSNFAGVQRAPAVFVCENNLYATATAAQHRDAQSGDRHQAAAYGMPGVAVDGNDVLAVWLAMQGGGRARPPRRRADADRGQDLPHRRPPRGRSGHRHLPHAGGDRRLGQARPDRHVPPKRLVEDYASSSRQELDAIEARDRRGIVEDAIDFARRSPEPDPATVRRARLCRAAQPARSARGPAADRPDARRRAGSTRCATASPRRCGAIRRSSISARAPASAAAPSRTPRICGQEFGAERMVDTPISEQGFTGAALGASATGARTVADLMFADFLFETAGQIVLQAAKLRYMSQRPDARRRWWSASAPARCAAPGRTTAASTIRSWPTCRASSSACPRRRPTPRA